MMSYNIQYSQAFVLSDFNNLTSNYLSSLIKFLLLIFMFSLLLALSSPPLIRITLLSCFLRKSGKMRSSSQTKAFQSYNHTFTPFPAWKLAVVPVGTGTGYLRIRVSLSNRGGPIKSSKATYTDKHYNIFCPNNMNPCFSL
jgi:hypothetical protein